MADRPRFDLEWLMPLELGLETHVALIDREREPYRVVAVARGADEADTLLALWMTLTSSSASDEAIAYAAAAYTKRTGTAPDVALS